MVNKKQMINKKSFKAVEQNDPERFRKDIDIETIRGLTNAVNSSQYSLEKGLLQEAIMFWAYVREKNLNNKDKCCQDIALENYLHNLVDITSLDETSFKLKENVYECEGGG